MLLDSGVATAMLRIRIQMRMCAWVRVCMGAWAYYWSNCDALCAYAHEGGVWVEVCVNVTAHGRMGAWNAWVHGLTSGSLRLVRRRALPSGLHPTRQYSWWTCNTTVGQA